MKDQALITTPNQQPQPHTAHFANTDKARYFDPLKAGMRPEEVINILGQPSKTSSAPTGKQWIPFYSGSDSRREYWSYPGIGYVVFTRNKYDATLSLIETRYDASAE